MTIKDFIYIGIILILSGYCAYLCNNKSQPVIIPEIDTIYVKKDSIIKNIKENQNNINQVDSIYKEDYIRITNQSSNEDLEFFSNYLDSMYR
jgi:hypothetical protein